MGRTVYLNGTICISQLKYGGTYIFIYKCHSYFYDDTDGSVWHDLSLYLGCYECCAWLTKRQYYKRTINGLKGDTSFSRWVEVCGMFYSDNNYWLTWFNAWNMSNVEIYDHALLLSYIYTSYVRRIIVSHYSDDWWIHFYMYLWCVLATEDTQRCMLRVCFENTQKTMIWFVNNVETVPNCAMFNIAYISWNIFLIPTKYFYM